MKRQKNYRRFLVLEDFSLHAAKEENVQFKLDDAFQYYKENELKKEAFSFENWEREETCVISYTSGTSGFTKGVMIPERSLVSNIVFAQDHMPLEPGHKIVSFLPMAHSYTGCSRLHSFYVPGNPGMPHYLFEPHPFAGCYYKSVW